MTSRVPELFVAAVLAASMPAAALAREHPCEHGDDDHRPAEYFPPPVYAPPPAYPAPPAPIRWREGSWRERRIAEIRAELWRLEARRAEVRARFGWNPRRLWRFERRYAVRHAELQRELRELQAVAWR